MELLRFVYPPEVARHMDPDSVTFSPGSMLDEELRATHSDLLFSTRLNGRDALAYLLFEHQSTGDASMPYRMLHCMSKIWTWWRRENPKRADLPIILPAVLSHAPGGWASPVVFSDLYDLDPSERGDFGARLLDFSMTVVDLSDRSDEEIRQAPIGPMSKLAFLSLKYGRVAKNLLPLLRQWMDLFKQAADAPHGEEESKVVWRYLYQVGVLPRHEVIELVRATKAGEKVEKAAMTTGEMLIEEGRQEGARGLFVEMLGERFGPLPVQLAERVWSATPEAFEQMKKAVWSASSLDELFESK